MRALFILPFSFFGLTVSALSQSTIQGPVCVLPATEYRYLVSNNNTAQANVSICIEGGRLAGTDSVCYHGSPISVVRIVWNENLVSGRVSFGSGQNAYQLNVSITKRLSGGSIESGSMMKLVSPQSMPTLIMCTAAEGGSCSPVYSYQWQVSSNNLSWQNISGAVSINLNVGVPVTSTTYYRRRVSESNSSSSRYSNIAMIIPAIQNTNN